MANEAIMPSPSAHGTRSGRKTFIPLENNPKVMNPLAHRLGLTPSLGFHDVLSLTDADLLAWTPRPCYALLFIFPVTRTSEDFYEREDSTLPYYEGSGSEEPSMFFPQTIGNACGLIGLIHCMCNINFKDVQALLPDSDFRKFVEEAMPLKPAARAQLVYDSELLETAHGEAAQRGDSDVPLAEEEPPCGFVTFVRGKDGHLYELEGRRKGPLDRGVIEPGEDLLSPAVIAKGPGQWLEREKAAGGDCRFSCLALGPAAE